MPGLSPLGVLHTVVSLVALFAGLAALRRHFEISTGSRPGRVFAIGTVLSCVTGLGIYRHDGFGVPHVLAIVTLIVLAAAYAAERGAFARAARYVCVVGYSLALFFHFIPGTVETLIRLPAGAPYLAGPQDPKAQPIIGVFFVLFLIGAVLQVLRLRTEARVRVSTVQPADG